MVSAINSFKSKLQFWKENLSKRSLDHFPRMKKVIGENSFDPNLFIGHLQKLLEQFENRFQQFSIIEPVASFFVNPFNPQINISEVANSMGKIIQEEASSIEDEILNIQTDIVLKSCGLNENIWNLAEDKKYPF